MLLVLGGLGIAAFNTLVYFGLQTTSAVNALLLQSAMPVVILATTFLLYRERPRVLQMLGVLVSIIGVFVIATKGNWQALAQLRFNTGDLWVLAAVGAYALYSALLRERPAVSPLSFLAATFAIGVLMLLPLYIHEHMRIAHVQPALMSYLAIAYVSVFPGFLSYLLYNRGVELAGANTAGHFMHLMPIFGSGLAILLLGERFTSFHFAGAAVKEIVLCQWREPVRCLAIPGAAALPANRSACSSATGDDLPLLHHDAGREGAAQLDHAEGTL